MLERLIDGYCRVLTLVVVTLLAGMVVLVFGNVVLRYGFNSGLVFSEEISRFVFMWLTLLGALVALHDGAHLGMDSVVERLPPRGRRLSGSGWHRRAHRRAGAGRSPPWSCRCRSRRSGLSIRGRTRRWPR
jgi:TRAP-type C4-dicarboxylate transport system permease small subunit